MTLKKKLCLTWVSCFVVALVVGILNKAKAGLWPNIWPDGIALIIVSSVTSAFAITLVCGVFGGVFERDKKYGEKYFRLIFVGFILSLVLVFTIKIWLA
ncbi:MAG: hypothetical protein HYV51_00870 [Parcubacteria group bacterium]|nr:hypothetical protein [Parcubacteria group bacterium]